LFLFGSELKAIISHSAFIKDVNFNLLPEYINQGYIKAPNCIYSNTYKLLPGHYFEIDILTWNFCYKKYWDFELLYYELHRLKYIY
jgi:asparagine synthase (glutamine-hydrolysing)